MQLDRVDDLFKSGRINLYQYETYYTFMGDVISQNFLKHQMDSILMEPVKAGADFACVYVGRISVWQEIKGVIDGINNLLEGKNYDGTYQDDNG